MFGSPFLNRLSVLTGRSVEEELLTGHVEEVNWINYLRCKMSVVGDKELYFVFLLFHLSPAFWVLAFDNVLIQQSFLPKHLSGGFPKFPPFVLHPGLTPETNRLTNERRKNFHT